MRSKFWLGLIFVLIILSSIIVFSSTDVIIPVPEGWYGFSWAGQHDDWKPYELVEGKPLYIKLADGSEYEPKSDATRGSNTIQHGTPKVIDKIRLFFDDDNGDNRKIDVYIYNQQEKMFKIVENFNIYRTGADFCGYDGCKECDRECMWEFDVSVGGVPITSELTGIKVDLVGGSGNKPDYFGMFYKLGECTDWDEDGFYVEDYCGTKVDCFDFAETVCPNSTQCPEICDGRDNDCDNKIDKDDESLEPCSSRNATCENKACIEQYDFLDFGEFGRIENLHNRFSYSIEEYFEFLSVNFKNSYSNPIVIAKPLSYWGIDPGHARLQYTTGDSFNIKVEEWDYLSPWQRRIHDWPERVNYLVIDKGQYDLNGLKIQAGNFRYETTDYPYPVNVVFPKNFSSTPIVLAQVQSYNGYEAIVVRVSDITKTGFKVRLQEQESYMDVTNENYGHVQEIIGWIAFEPGIGEFGNIRYEFKVKERVRGDAEKRDDKIVLANWTQINFQQGFDWPPFFLADMQTYTGPDPAGLRYRNLEKNSVEVVVEEEQSKDEEMRHIEENVGFIALRPYEEEIPLEPELTYANWTKGGVKINNAGDGWQVNMTIKGINLDDGIIINFTIYEAEPLGAKDYVTEMTATIKNNEARATWTTQWINDGFLEGDPEYFFIASLVTNPSVSIQSPELAVTKQCICEDGTACGGCSIVSLGQYCNETGGLKTDYSTCPECGSDEDCSPLSCVEGQCVPVGIITCEDYTDEGNCTADSEDVAEFTWQTYYDNGEGSCGSQDISGCSYYDVTCKCKWSNGKCVGATDEDFDCGSGPVIGECIFQSSTLVSDCDENDERKVMIDYEWAGAQPSQVCIDKTISQPCLSQVLLPFFNTLNLIIAILIIIIFYLIVLRKRKRIGKKAIKRRKSK